MAITAVTSCLGPPPLPPGKRFLQKSSKKLSSTYRSFRDPAVESWIPGGVLDMSRAARLHPRRSERSPMICAISNGNLFRSRSEGNLSARKTSAVLSATPLDKCIQAIYGSWKNLMHRKCNALLARRCSTYSPHITPSLPHRHSVLRNRSSKL